MSASSFGDLRRAAPELGEPIHARFVAAGLGILGTTRSDGSARVSPIEVTFVDDRLYVGCMPGSLKQLDLDRDPRCCLLTPIADKHDLGGEGKVYGLARRCEPGEARRVLEAAVAAMEQDVSVDDFGDSPVFELTVQSAAWQQARGDAWVTWSWDPIRGRRVRSRTGPLGEVIEGLPAGGHHPDAGSAPSLGQ